MVAEEEAEAAEREDVARLRRDAVVQPRVARAQRAKTRMTAVIGCRSESAVVCCGAFCRRLNTR